MKKSSQPDPSLRAASADKLPAQAAGDGQVDRTLGIGALKAGRVPEAISRLERALAAQPASADTHNNLGVALQLAGRLDEAAEHYRKEISLQPASVDALANLGNLLVLAGRLDEALPAYERAVALAPNRMDLHRALAGLKHYAPGDSHLAALEAIAQSRPSLTEAQQSDLQFALGKAWSDLGDGPRSFDHWSQANALHRRQIAYNEASALALSESIRTAFGPELMQRMTGGGDRSPVPVFIFGMPRSGTSLVEQILASHPAVFGGGELSALGQVIRSVLGPGPGAASERISRVMPALTAADWQKLGAGYLDRIKPLAGSPADRITDKMPGNFHYAGLIHLALPNARMVHVRRNPLDTCLSCFATRFNDGQLPYAYDLGELGRYYRAYETLMEHWRRVLPPGAMLEVDYEDVVTDLEAQARRLVAHCGLAWDPACLAFHRNRRPVRTASAVQVRQPLYASSVGRSRAYGPLLQPLLDALGRGDAA